MKTRKGITKALFLRRGFGINQEVMSSKLNISRPTLTRKEKGETDFTKSEMEIYTNILKEYDPSLTINSIFFEDDFTIWKKSSKKFSKWKYWILILAKH